MPGNPGRPHQPHHIQVDPLSDQGFKKCLTVCVCVPSSLGEGEMCRPLLVESSVPFLDIRDGRHPCVSHTYSGDDFIPNDIVINGGRSQEGCLVVVVTGPNMGGKSTLMRQTGLIMILAQLVRKWSL